MKFIPSAKGWRKVLSEYQELALRAVWENPEEGSISREIWETVNNQLREGPISRASVTIFLNEMVEQGILESTMESCRGGFRARYRPLLGEKEFKEYIAKTMIESLLRDFPEETRKVLSEALQG